MQRYLPMAQSPPPMANPLLFDELLLIAHGIPEQGPTVQTYLPTVIGEPLSDRPWLANAVLGSYRRRMAYVVGGTGS
jgi:hypothetical protein